MTIEEKAQRYDKAIKELKGLLDGVHEDKCEIMEEDITNIFPELKEKESEDEKIRKWLINYFREVCDNVAEKEKNAVIAWLEKQSTPQVRTGLEWVNTIDDACDKRYSEEYAHGEYCHEQSFKWGFQEGVDWLEKQGESTDINPSEFDLRLNKLLKQFETLSKEELASSLSFYLNVVQNDGTYKADEKKGEQKPAWSEEDERAIGIIKVALEHPYAMEGKWDRKFALDWLKSLKDRVQLQSKQEWSDENEIGLGDALWAIEQAKTIAKDENDMGNLWHAERWLKSLKPQNHWKPNKEQIRALHDLNLTGNISYAGQGQVLIELYNDLEKLTE